MFSYLVYVNLQQHSVCLFQSYMFLFQLCSTKRYSETDTHHDCVICYEVQVQSEVVLFQGSLSSAAVDFVGIHCVWFIL